MTVSSAQLNTVRINVKGLVQGVGFRWFVQKTARNLDIKGWVENLDDGSVEILAQGSADNIESFLESLKNKHPHANVENIETKKIGNSEEYTDFEIKL